MTWNTQQKEQSFKNYWQMGQATCPECSGALEFSVQSLIGNALIEVHCPSCAHDALLNVAQEQKLRRWRPWTDLELCVLVDDHYNGRTSACAVCKTQVTVTQEPAASGNRLTFKCRRCGNRVSG